MEQNKRSNIYFMHSQTDTWADFKPQTVKAEPVAIHFAQYCRKCNRDSLPAQSFSLKPQTVLNKQEMNLIHFPELAEQHQGTFLYPDGFANFRSNLPTSLRRFLLTPESSASSHPRLIWIFKTTFSTTLL